MSEPNRLEEKIDRILDHIGELRADVAVLNAVDASGRINKLTDAHSSLAERVAKTEVRAGAFSAFVSLIVGSLISLFFSNNQGQ